MARNRGELPQPTPRTSVPNPGGERAKPHCCPEPLRHCARVLVTQGGALGEGVGRRSGVAGGPRRSRTPGNLASGPERPSR